MQNVPVLWNICRERLQFCAGTFVVLV